MVSDAAVLGTDSDSLTLLAFLRVLAICIQADCHPLLL